MSWRVPVEARSDRVFPLPLAGTVENHRLESRVLRGNPWGDPSERDLPVYVPPSGETRERPVLVLLSGYTGAGWVEYERPLYLRDSIVGVLDRLIRLRLVPEAVMVGPDCLTTLGGSQYLNSSATGRYEDYVVEEVIPFVRQRYRTGPVAVMGTSSGGYGSLMLTLRHPEVFRAAGSNAGDAFFEYCYTPDFPIAFREFQKAGGPEKLLEKMLSEPTPGFGPREPRAQALEVMAYSSSYSPIEGEPGRFDLPFDLVTGAIRPDVWARWLSWDPVRMVADPRYQEAARSVPYWYVDGGAKDEYALDLGARIFADAARRAGARVDLELFEGAHFDATPRYEVIIPRLLSALGVPPPERG
jgi:enterochelin esterase family protein